MCADDGVLIRTVVVNVNAVYLSAKVDRGTLVICYEVDKSMSMLSIWSAKVDKGTLVMFCNVDRYMSMFYTLVSPIRN